MTVILIACPVANGNFASWIPTIILRKLPDTLRQILFSRDMSQTKFMRYKISAMLLVCFLLGLTFTAHAHATRIFSDPAAGATISKLPEQVVLRFDEAVSNGIVRLVDSDFRRTPLENLKSSQPETITAKMPAKLAYGLYTIEYDVFSADGHPISESIQFSYQSEGISGLTLFLMALIGLGGSALFGLLLIQRDF